MIEKTSGITTDILVLRSAFGKAGQIYTLQPAIDPKTNRYPPHIRTVDTLGNMILSEEDKSGNEILFPVTEMFEFVDGQTIDRNDEYQNAVWEAVKHNKIIAPARYAKDASGNNIIDGSRKKYSSVAELYIYEPNAELEAKLSKRQLIHEANVKIYGETPEFRRKIFKILGNDPTGIHDANIIDTLQRIAESNPKKIIDLFLGTDLHIQLLFIDAKNKNVIYSKNNVYMYGDTVALGVSQDAVLNFFKDSRNKSVVDLIRKETYGEELEITNTNYLKVEAAKELAKEEALKEKLRQEIMAELTAKEIKDTEKSAKEKILESTNKTSSKSNK